MASSSLAAGSGTWVGNAGTLWTTNTSATNNWTGGYPSLPGHTATFDNSATGSRSLDLGGNQTVGGIILNAPATASYTLGTPATPHTLTLDNGANPATVTVTDGSHTLNAKTLLASHTTVSYRHGHPGDLCPGDR